MTHSDDIEEWRPVEGTDGYYSISSWGRVRRDIGDGQRTYAGRILKPGLAGFGYPFVNLRVPDGLHGQSYIHRLVAAAFLGPPPALPHIEVNHIDGVKTNNHVSNLEWKTPSENQTHSYDTGLHPRGETHYKARLTEDDVRFMRHDGLTMDIDELAARFGIHRNHVYAIRRGVGWRHVN